MDRRMNQDSGRIALGQAIDRGLAAMRRSIVDDPKHAVGRLVRLLFHDLLDQLAKRVDSGGRFAAAHNVAAAYVPGGEVLQRAATLVFEFDAAGSARRWLQAMRTNACLDAGLLIRADDVIVRAERFALIKTSIKVENDLGFLGKMRIARKDPIIETPRFQIGLMQATPHRGGADRFLQGAAGSSRQVRHGLSAKRLVGLVDEFASDRLYDGSIQRGKNRACARVPVYPPTKNHPTPRGVANAEPNRPACEARRQLPGAKSAAVRATDRPTPLVAAAEKKSCVGAVVLGLRPRTGPERPDDA